MGQPLLLQPGDHRRRGGAGSRAFQHTLPLMRMAGHWDLLGLRQSLPGTLNCKQGWGSRPAGASPREQHGKKTLLGLSEEPGAALCLKLSVESEICNRRNISISLNQASVFPPG